MVRKADRARALLGALAFGALAVVGSGCAGASDELSHEISKMQTEVMGLRAQTAALTERLEALESRPAAPRESVPAAAEPASDPRPPLRVVHLGPGDGVPAAEAPYDVAVSEVPEGRVRIRSTANGLVQEDPDAPISSSKSSVADKKPKSSTSKSDASKKN